MLQAGTVVFARFILEKEFLQMENGMLLSSWGLCLF
jgi:hypothetical protein